MAGENNPFRAILEKATLELFGTLNEMPGLPIWEIFGIAAKTPRIGSTNWYDTSAFFAVSNVHVGEEWEYVYGDSRLEAKPAKYFKYTAGVKITEDEADGLDEDSLVAQITVEAKKQETAVRAKAELEGVGYKADVEGTGFGWGALRLGAASSPTIIDPYDCQSTSGTVENLETVNFTGAGKTAENLNATIGVAIRAISAAVLDAESGESILRNDGTDTYTLWCHPTFAAILRTNHDIRIAAAEMDKLPYSKQLMEAWDTVIKPTMAIGACTGIADATSVMILTANTKENFFVVPVVEAHWKPWKDIDDGNKIFWVKRFKAGMGFLPRPFIDTAGDPYKAMFAMSITPNGA